MQQIENVIIGGGPVGLIMAFNLAKLGYMLTIFDNNDWLTIKDDGRILSLSYASYDYMKSIGINIPNNILTPIKNVYISHSGFGSCKINSQLLQKDQLGYTIRYSDLYQVIYQQVKNINSIKLINKKVVKIIPQDEATLITYIDNNYEKHLLALQLIMAEGGNLASGLINYHYYDYQQVAIITKIKGSIPHNNIAYERFDKNGIIALLPHFDHYVLIFSVPTAKKEFFLDQFNYKSFLTKHNFMKKIGDFDFIASTKYFPLQLKIAEKRIVNNIALIGSSAQIINPIAAQGLNLSIRDIRYFTKIVAKKGMNIQSFSDEYHESRNYDVNFVKYFTHILNAIVSYDNFFINQIKGLGILALDNILSIKKYVTNKLISGN